MNVSIEKTIIVLVVISFIFASANSFILHVPFITREEAIETSRRTELVQSYMETADDHFVKAGYLNRTQVNKVREENPYFQERYPKDSSVWIVSWYIHPKGAGSVTIMVIHIIDAETGQIWREEHGSAR
ncbi:MAG: hypothetical protein JSV12_00880 [Candidatus Bathyarchaeota archaeon]|nr:MAG: hypothetical protein JSV12_00880 [Candidatus Bathyarchaeota archaeon]